MPTDVVRKIIEANGHKNGAARVAYPGRSQRTTKTFYERAILQNVDLEKLFNRLDTRLDEVRYYEGDTSS